ncbi:MAG: GMC family oxidoreductase [Azospirillaceae bacterium]
MTTSPDIVIIGSGMGGATMAHALAPTGASIVILERGQRLEDGPSARDADAIFRRGVYRPEETWLDGEGRPFSPGNYYFHGGNTKFYGAVLLRLREADFEAMEHEGGLSPAWPIGYADLAPWYDAAERLYKVAGSTGEDPTEPPHTSPYPRPPIPDEPAIAAVRERLRRVGLNPFTLPLGLDIDAWLKRGRTTWDAYPDTRCGKMDAENCALTPALDHDNVTLVSGAEVVRLTTRLGSSLIEGVEYRHEGESRRLTPKLVILSAGAVNSAALLLRSANDDFPAGLGNRSDQVGRHFMNHNCSAMLSIDPRRVNDAVYQKTLGINDFYLEDEDGGSPLGNVQLLGKVTAPILKSQLPALPLAVLRWLCRHSVDWYLMSEDLPDPNSRVTVDGAGRIRLDWRRSNMGAHGRLVRTMRRLLKKAGYPIVLSRTFDRRTPSHQCGTVRFGNDPATAVLDPYCRVFDHQNLFVVDAGFMPSSAAVNPALTIAAMALCVANHVRQKDLVA